VTRAKYLSSVGICHGRVLARPMPLDCVAATMTVNGRRGRGIEGSDVVFEFGLDEDIGSVGCWLLQLLLLD